MTPGRAGSRGRRPIARTRRSDRAGGSTRSGKASVSARARSCSSTCASLISRRRRQPADNSRAPSARWDSSDRHRRHRRSRSGSLPPRPRSVRSTATSAAAAPKSRSRASRSMCASRGSSGSAAMALPWPVTRPPNPAPQLMTDDRAPPPLQWPAEYRGMAGALGPPRPRGGK